MEGRERSRRVGGRVGRPWLAVLVGIAALLGNVELAAAGPRQRCVQTKYYVLYTDLDEAGAREVALRIDLMAEEYYARTRGLAGTVREKLPFHVFRGEQAYYEAGGQPGKAGLFTGKKLLALVPAANPGATWHVVQHEGFHQFLLAAVGQNIPIWANEGLAEYFGQAEFTGDQFVTGLIPAYRQERLVPAIRGRRTRPFQDIMKLGDRAWFEQSSVADYDQAWSMVHFLAHGDDGRYQKAFMGFLKSVSQGTAAAEAWARNFGSDVRAFEERWRQYWLGLPENPTLDRYAEATVATLTSFLARAASQRQDFEDAPAFFRTAQAGELLMNASDWLPRSLLADALQRAPHVGRWSLHRQAGHPRLVCVLETGQTLEGGFVLDGLRVKRVEVARR